MEKRNDLINLFVSLILIFTLALTSISLWLYEILSIKGWAGLNWLSSGIIFSPYAIALLTAFAFLIPFVMYKQISLKKTLLLILIFYLINVFYFELGKEVNCTFLFARCSYSIMKSNHFLHYLLLISMFGLPFFGRVYWFVINKLIFKNKKSNIHLVSVLSILTVPFSLLTIEIDPGYGTSTDWIDAIKMGYPMFWITIFLGVSGIYIARQEEEEFKK